MAQSESETTTVAMDDNYSADDVAAELEAQMTAEELRRLAAHSDASRPRGATKSETAEVVAEQDQELAAEVAEGGDFSVTCTCGLSMEVSHPQVARRVAKEHKSQQLTHFPKARDDSDDSRIYG